MRESGRPEHATHRDGGNTIGVGNTIGATHRDVGNTNRAGKTIGTACGLRHQRSMIVFLADDF